MTTKKYLPYGKQSINHDDIISVQKALEQDIITRGAYVHAFEREVAAFCNAKWAVAFNSGTTALYAASQAIDVSSQDKFITTPNSFIATTAAGMRLGARPIFTDIDTKTGNMQEEQIVSSMSEPLSRGRYVISCMHYAGIAQDMPRLDKMINSPDTVVIEDAAHALGSQYSDGTMVGSCKWSQMTVFSFHPVKTITSAEGGMVTTNDDALYHRLKRIRNNGIEKEKPYLHGSEDPWYYEVHELGANYHMNEMQAALGLSQLQRLEAFIEKRRSLVRVYYEKLQGVPHIRLFDKSCIDRTAYHLMAVYIDFEACKTSRTQVMNKLHDLGIGSQYHYVPIYRFPVLERLYGEQYEKFPQMEHHYKQELSLPLFYDMNQDDVTYVVDSLLRVLELR